MKGILTAFAWVVVLSIVLPVALVSFFAAVAMGCVEVGRSALDALMRYLA